MAAPLALSGPSPRLQDLPYVRQVAMLVGLAAAIALGLYVFTWAQKPNFVPIYPGLADKDASEVMEALRAAQVAVQLDPVTGTVTVPESALQEARLKLAAQGLPAGSRMGIELIQQGQGFGASQFVETARYQHALETELARTIGALRPVRNARVHLAMPRASVFTTRREPASASVLVELFPGRMLEPEQVAAVVHMVASSIPELSPERVTVIDQSGRLLTRDGSNGEEQIAARQFEQTRRLETSYVERIERLLAPLTGAGRVSAQVAVDLDFAVIEEARESFAPDTRLRSEQVSEAVSENKTTGGIPGAVSNQPPQTAPPTTADATAVAQGGGSTPSNATRSATRNFEMDRTVSHTRQPAGRVKRVSVAVLVDHVQPAALAAEAAADAADEDDEDDEDDAPVNAAMRALTAEELTQVERLVKEAVGFNSERGDSVSIMNAPFARPEALGDPEVIPLWQQPELRDYARLGIGAIVVLVLVFGVLKPLLRNLAQPQEILARVERGEYPALTGETVSLAEILPAQLDAHAQRVAAAKVAAAQDPRKVAQVVKNWVGGDA